jgi:hypothetical protein
MQLRSCCTLASTCSRQLACVFCSSQWQQAANQPWASSATGLGQQRLAAPACWTLRPETPQPICRTSAVALSPENITTCCKLTAKPREGCTNPAGSMLSPKMGGPMPASVMVRAPCTHHGPHSHSVSAAALGRLLVQLCGPDAGGLGCATRQLLSRVSFAAALGPLACLLSGLCLRAQQGSRLHFLPGRCWA